MATITEPTIIKEMLANGGRYRGDPAPDSIWAYKSPMNGNQYFACFYFGQYCDVYDSPYVEDPVLLFVDGELTDDGRAMIDP